MREDTTEINPTWLKTTGGYAKDMTLRDYFAGLYMQGFLPDDSLFHEGIAKAAYKIADAMIKERE